jgi:muramoyltetrapeptide carboxypeptidase
MKSSRFTLPHALPAGGTIGIFSPAGPPDPARVERGVKRIESLGYRCVLAENALGAHEYFSAPDTVRVESLHKMLADPGIDMMMMTRGGYGLSRILHHINWDAVARANKILCGFSDFTALSLAALSQANLVTFAGPGVATDFGDETFTGANGDKNGDDHAFMESYFWPLTRHEALTIEMADAHPYAATTLSGVLWGSNLSLLTHLVGTRFMPEIAGGILFVEEIAEQPYAIERLFLQLYHAGILQSQTAIVLGDFSDCEPEGNRFPYQMSHVVRTLRELLPCPVLVGLPFGHVARKLTLPFGAEATLDIADGRYRLHY